MSYTRRCHHRCKLQPDSASINFPSHRQRVSLYRRSFTQPLRCTLGLVFGAARRRGVVHLRSSGAAACSRRGTCTAARTAPRTRSRTGTCTRTGARAPPAHRNKEQRVGCHRPRLSDRHTLPTADLHASCPCCPQYVSACPARRLATAVCGGGSPGPCPPRSCARPSHLQSHTDDPQRQGRAVIRYRCQVSSSRGRSKY